MTEIVFGINTLAVCLVFPSVYFVYVCVCVCVCVYIHGWLSVCSSDPSVSVSQSVCLLFCLCSAIVVFFVCLFC